MYLSRSASVAFLSLFAFVSSANCVFAADAVTRITIFPSFTSTVPSTPNPGTTNGRACIFGDGAALAEDPTGACLGTFRVITPASPASVSTFLASATASVALLGGGNKSLTANAFDIGPDYAVAESKDPITVGPVAAPGLLSVSLLLDQLSIRSDSAGPAITTDKLAANLPAEQTLFSLTVTATGGTAPTVSLDLSPFLTAEGWDDSALTAALNAALLAGADGTGGYSLSGFSLPNFTIDVPAGVQAQLTGDAAAQAGAPEPSTILLVGVGAALCALRIVRARASNRSSCGGCRHV